MKKKIKKFIKYIAYLPINFLISFGIFYSNILSKFSNKLYWEDKIEKREKKISSLKIGNNVNLKFYVVNSITKFRTETFFNKEPDTIDWIKNYNGTGDFLDIGANIGIYSNFFAKIKKGHVYAFESSFYNLSLLAENCQINNNEDKITIFPIPLFNNNNVNYFKINDPIIGGALSTFNVDYGFDGKKINNFQKYLIPGFSLDFLFENKILNKIPSLVKIDVDGVEDLILDGSTIILKSDLCKSVLVEVNEDFEKQYENIQKIMTDSGFELFSSGKKTNLKSLSSSKKFQNTYNQIWSKN